ncbi:MAG TPA: sugar transferase [Actinomycetes bacterium]|jgi:lipopolysaccharide/colanic/teichoic acid biosynthesis glycosyltransferase|nr:sugar transferase [Actinomycetes bacterium]
MRTATYGVPPGPPRRALDLLITGTAFLLLLPLFVLLALLVMLSSPGPVIFRQERVGQGGVPFTLLKFRTMRSGSSGPNVTVGDDARLTRIGKLLRHAGLDELPQLINILKGEMTLVGPRPETLDLAMRYPSGCEAVFQHRPGLTGPAAVRLRDRDRLRASSQDLEEYYLRVVVPTKVAVDLEFLAAPTLPRTVGVMAETLLYIVTGGRTHRAVPIAAIAETQQPGRTGGALSSSSSSS